MVSQCVNLLFILIHSKKIKRIESFVWDRVIGSPIFIKLLKKMGYGDFIETSKTGDGGIDGIINEDQLGLEKIYIQAKRYNETKVRETDIRNFIGAMSGDMDMVITIVANHVRG